MNTRFRIVSRSILALLMVGFLLQGCAKPAEEHLQRAIDYEAEAQYQAAIIELRNALRQDPEIAEARFRLGTLYLELGDHLAAAAEIARAQRLGWEHERLPLLLAQARVASGDEREVRKVVADHDGRPLAELSVDMAAVLARAMARLGRLDEARSLLEANLKRDPDNLESRLGLASVLRQEGDDDAALRQARRAVELASRSRQAYLLLGELQLGSGQASSARESFESALDLAVQSGAPASRARIALARAMVSAGDIASAGPVIDVVLSELPDLPVAHYLSAIVDINAGNDEDAQGSLEKVLRQIPDHVASRYYRGLIAYRQGSLERARDDLQRVIARDPAHMDARMLLAAMHSDDGDHESAVEVLEAGLQAPGVRLHAGHYTALGQSLLRIGNTDEALEMLTRAAALSPDSAAIRTQLAIGHLASGALDEAESELSEVIDLSAQFPVSDTLLVLTRLEAGRTEAAIAAAQAFAERTPESPMAFNMLGVAYHADEQFARALDAFADALRLDESFAPAALNAADVQVRAGEIDSARNHLEAALADQPGHVLLRMRLAEFDAAARRLPQAIEHLERARQDHRGNEDLNIMYAELLVRAGQPQRALQVLALPADTSQASDRWLAARSQVAVQAGRATEAIAALDILLQRQPESVDAALGLASALAGVGDDARALAILSQRANTGGEVASRLLVLQADILIGDGRLEAAEAIIERLDERSDAGPARSRLQGDLFMARKKPEQAAEQYAIAYRGQPANRILHNLVEAHEQAGDRGAAEAALRSAMLERPDDFVVLGMFAERQVERGRHREAVEAYEKMHELLPGNPAVLNNLAWAYGEIGDPRAIELARQAHAEAPGSAAIMDTLGWILVRQGHEAEGVAMLRDAAARSPGDAGLRYRLAVGLERQGAVGEALEQVTTALAGTSEFDEAEDARALLERLGG